MVLSTSQQALLGFTAVLFTFVVLPRMFGVGIGSGGAATKETRYDRFNRKVGPGPGAVRGPPGGVRGPPGGVRGPPGGVGSAQSLENMQQMKMMMEQELKSEKFKPNSNKGYVFTLMPLYAVGVGVFAAYKFLKIKSADSCQTQKTKAVKGVKKSAEAESQLNELEQRLAQTEKMLNSILTQLDPLTNCVKTVAQEQKNEIMSQLQTIRYLMKKRGMDCPPIRTQESSCERNLDDLIKSLSVHEALSSAHEGLGSAHEALSSAHAAQRGGGEEPAHEQIHKPNDNEEEAAATEEEEEMVEESVDEKEARKGDEEDEEEDEDGRHEDEEEEHEGRDLLEDCDGPQVENIGAVELSTTTQPPPPPPPSGLRRRARPE